MISCYLKNWNCAWLGLMKHDEQIEYLEVAFKLLNKLFIEVKIYLYH